MESPLYNTVVNDIQAMDLSEMVEFLSTVPFTKHGVPETHHPIVSAIVDTCTTATYEYNDAATVPPGQYDIACTLWRWFDITFDNQWL